MSKKQREWDARRYVEAHPTEVVKAIHALMPEKSARTLCKNNSTEVVWAVQHLLAISCTHKCSECKYKPFCTSFKP